jgi:hypothetical protein
VNDSSGGPVTEYAQHYNCSHPSNTPAIGSPQDARHPVHSSGER